MTLFVNRPLTGHAGFTLNFKIECDALSDEDIESIAAMINRSMRFRQVIGVPHGGIRLANALQKYKTCNGITLLVDDVLTTGTSMEEAKKARNGEVVAGVVIFARGPCPDWVRSIFQLQPWVVN